MSNSLHNDTPNTNLRNFNIIVFLACLPVLFFGAFTTTIGAGMAFLDWPTSDGSLNPDGWLTDRDKFAEHSHRLLAGLAMILTVIMAIKHAKIEARTWVRKTAYWAVVLILAQALLGGLRVVLNDVDIAIPHAILAQFFLCLLVSLIWVHTKRWNQLYYPNEVYEKLSGLRSGALAIVILIFIQLIVGAVMRHKQAWSAIPTFPFSTAEGDLLPGAWNFLVSIHFAHRVIAVIILLVFVTWAIRAFCSLDFPRHLRSLILLSAFLLLVQIGLGASIIWYHKPPFPTSFHVLVGACLLASLWSITFLMSKPFFEKRV